MARVPFRLRVVARMTNGSLRHRRRSLFPPSSGVRGMDCIARAPHTPLTPTPRPRPGGEGSMRAASAAADDPDAGAQADDADGEQCHRDPEDLAPELPGVLRLDRVGL